MSSTSAARAKLALSTMAVSTRRPFTIFSLIAMQIFVIIDHE
jgi:hypothetical protein